MFQWKVNVAGSRYELQTGIKSKERTEKPVVYLFIFYSPAAMNKQVAEKNSNHKGYKEKFYGVLKERKILI